MSENMGTVEAPGHFGNGETSFQPKNPRRHIKWDVKGLFVAVVNSRPAKVVAGLFVAGVAIYAAILIISAIFSIPQGVENFRTNWEISQLDREERARQTFCGENPDASVCQTP